MDYERFVDEFNARDMCSHNMGIRLVSVAKGEASAELALTDKCSNFSGTMHGGALATLADITSGCAVVHHGRVPVTLDANVRYLRAVRGGKVRAHAKELRGGRNICVCRVEMYDAEDRLCTFGSITMFLTDTEITAFG